MNDQLEEKSDQELNELFAVEVAAVHLNRDLAYGWTDPHGRERATCDWPYGYTEDANAVLPWLPKEASCDYWAAHGGYLGVRVAIYGGGKDCIRAEACALTFPRAAVLALLRAKRGSKA